MGCCALNTLFDDALNNERNEHQLMCQMYETIQSHFVFWCIPFHWIHLIHFAMYPIAIKNKSNIYCLMTCSDDSMNMIWWIYINFKSDSFQNYTIQNIEFGIQASNIRSGDKHAKQRSKITKCENKYRMWMWNVNGAMKHLSFTILRDLCEALEAHSTAPYDKHSIRNAYIICRCTDKIALKFPFWICVWQWRLAIGYGVCCIVVCIIKILQCFNLLMHRMLEYISP